ncbi:2-keto-3-deoxy-D-arabino-heptulosonate-7-phosphate synthase I beta [Dehalobacter sp. UNSWDHB]|jgi:phospho-2-dehydro-3-deoxyheptonate aldolase|uniref:3-deoxy-7-phosphoheptulonate synthase n=1 Tax=unclassified Dehalobacter TaxID=2635733 RepID=UPI00028AC207|nr:MULTISPECIES: 3-deoxy-7-phosphoheptulonate synthase [unclassified Dehalobacter]AFV03239.1 2-keto-3-deoxy-D-arabino-heptulosonate-7-phosphate synthase I beta [Dehalobacter sp. DCA]AFV06224.1 2-keto-3-deoxy-D-arabino-heptulosonate-7-phosphate synthase I beta [Dehalobacter sp. CF]EQB21011.1 2-keto-3-deoxy-D-arabino-heptulosonate-7-phosphate synthase I beta [Dehalobacter sp. UNSWDHB]
MIIVMRPKTPPEEIAKMKQKILDLGCEVHESLGVNYHILGLIGNTSSIDPDTLHANDYVEKVIHVQEPFKKVNRLFHPEDTVISVGDRKIGGDTFAVIAGPCSVESETQIVGIAETVKKSGAAFLRGGAFKPRSSPYSFQGLREDGLELLKIARTKTGLPIVSELMSTEYLERFVEDVDIIQIGARNMQNFELLKEVGKIQKPVILKRGLSSTIEELLLAAEYILAHGNENVIFCERGIRTFENYTRNTLDLTAVPVIKKLSHLPVIVDPSHAAGLWWLVEPMAKAAMVVGADGVMIEVHNDPANAKCDGQQSIKPERFEALMDSLRQLAVIQNKII